MNAHTFIKAAALFLLLGLFVVETADAQRSRRGESNQQTKEEERYPDATRAEPKIKVSPRVQRDLQRLLESNDNQDYPAVISQAEALINHRSAGNYERSLAYQLIGMAKAEQDDYTGAIQAYEKALEANGLNNNNHYQVMLQIAQLQYQEDQFDQANATLDRLLEETRKEDGQTLALKGAVLYQAERYAEAAEPLKRAIAASDKPQDSWTQMLLASYINAEQFDQAIALGEEMLANNPNDARLIYNVATMYAQIEHEDKATATLERARAANLLDERGYRQLYALYLNMDNKEAQVIEVIQDGLAKDIIKPSAEAYTMLGQAYYFSDKPNEAIEAYRKALPFSEKGDGALNLARILSNEERFAESKQYAQEAIAKGLSRPGDAWIVIGRAEHAMGNRAGLIAAYREAAKYPETKQVAEDWLKRNASR